MLSPINAAEDGASCYQGNVERYILASTRLKMELDGLLMMMSAEKSNLEERSPTSPLTKYLNKSPFRFVWELYYHRYYHLYRSFIVYVHGIDRPSIGLQML